MFFSFNASDEISKEAAEALFDASFPQIKELIDIVSSHKRVFGEDAEDLYSYAMLKLVDNDFKKIRVYKRRNGASFKTFLGEVIQRIYIDWFRTINKRRQPPAWVKKLGKPASVLWQLICLKKNSFDDAYEKLTIKLKIEIRKEEAATVYKKLLEDRTCGQDFKEVELEECEPIPSPNPPPDEAAFNNARTELIQKLINNISEEDRLIFKMYYWGEFSMEEIANSFSPKMKRIEIDRRIKSALKEFGRELDAMNIKKEDIL